MPEKKTKKATAKKSKVPSRIKDLSPKKNPRGGDRPHNVAGGGGSADE